MLLKWDVNHTNGVRSMLEINGVIHQLFGLFKNSVTGDNCLVGEHPDNHDDNQPGFFELKTGKILKPVKKPKYVTQHGHILTPKDNDLSTLYDIEGTRYVRVSLEQWLEHNN